MPVLRETCHSLEAPWKRGRSGFCTGASAVTYPGLKWPHSGENAAIVSVSGVERRLSWDP